MRLFLILLLGACSSSGVEPNWEAARSSDSHESYEGFTANPLQRYRVEWGQRNLDTGSQKGGQIRISRGRIGGSTQSQTRQTQHRQNSFVIGQAGNPLTLHFQGSSYQVVLGTLQGSSIEVAIAQISSQNLENTRSSSLQTRTRVPLGRWSSVGGLHQESESGRRQTRLGPNSGIQRDAHRQFDHYDLEIRITPLGP
jgi:hypothetical protein